ncbi:MAG: hypothetical protein JSV86_04425 [Gemmatimonadota bacterium]|nr:MAG: hypothetical protein JSV86_04425 [Gemmatimonadota bacterium]
MNHIFVVVDSATFESVRESEFLRERFAAFERRTTLLASGLTYTGLYFYGERTYFELLPADLGFAVGTTGIAYGVDGLDALGEVQEAWTRTFGSPPDTALQVRAKDDGEWVAWYRMLLAPRVETPGGLWTWAMVWAPDYLQTWWGDPDPAPAALGRREYLSKYFRPDLLLRDVIGAEFSLTEADERKLVKELGALGFEVTEEGETRLLRSDDVFFRIRRASSGLSSLRALVLRLNVQGGVPTTVSVGPTWELTIDGARQTAVWRFIGE